MTVNQLIRILAGSFIMLSLALGVAGSPIFVSHNWLWFTLFVGFNLFQSGFTRFCPLEIALRKLGAKDSLEGNGTRSARCCGSN